eukprot:3590876-Amphidinium_carterae.3
MATPTGSEVSLPSTVDVPFSTAANLAMEVEPQVPPSDQVTESDQPMSTAMDISGSEGGNLVSSTPLPTDAPMLTGQESSDWVNLLPGASVTPPQ